MDGQPIDDAVVIAANQPDISKDLTLEIGEGSQFIGERGGVLSGRDPNEPQNQEQENPFHNQVLEGDCALPPMDCQA